MSIHLGHSHAHDHACPSMLSAAQAKRYGRVLWWALALNAAMFVLEAVAGIAAGSQALLADAIDFAGDAFNYGISLVVLGAATVWRARAALLKAASMLVFGVYVLARTAWAAYGGTLPHAATMGLVGMLALATNLAVAWMLYRYREGDANMRSVWLCSRNDAIGNVAVMLAAAGVFGTRHGWPDWIVAAGMALLALQAGWVVWRQARRELRAHATATPCTDH